MKFVVDEQLAPQVARWIESRGCEAWHVIDLGLLGQSDRLIAETAVERAAVMVTKDADYLEWRVSLPALRVLWLRVGNVPNRLLFEALEHGWPDAIRAFDAGRSLLQLRAGGAVEAVTRAS